jgi:acyl carrier protein
MTASRLSIEAIVRRVIKEQLSFAVDGSELSPDDNLWERGMTSLTCLGLMLNTEDAFGIEFPETLLKEATFRSISSIVAAVEGVRNPSGESLTGENVSDRGEPRVHQRDDLHPVTPPLPGE